MSHNLEVANTINKLNYKGISPYQYHFMKRSLSFRYLTVPYILYIPELQASLSHVASISDSLPTK